jgi:transcription initiation factor TFIID TATA-box-binding protein
MRKRKYSSLSPHEMRIPPEPDTPLPTVHNIVATSQISCSLPVLNLNKIHEMLPFSFYDQHKFAAITVRLHQPDCTTLLFSSGKLVVTGCRSWYECVYASLFITNLLEECIPGHSFRLLACDVQNMVAHVEIPVHGGCLDLHAMYARMALNCTYQRKMFPGLIYRPEASPVVLLCFFSGKIVITGGKTMDDMFTGWSRLWPTLKGFIISQPPPQALSGGGGGGGSTGTRKQRLAVLAPTSSQARGAHYKGLPLERDTVTSSPVGSLQTGEEDAGGRARGHEKIDLAQPSKLEGLGDNLAAECLPLVL